MKRDWELIRKILVKIEQETDESTFIFADAFKGHTEEEVNYHFKILNQAGLVELQDASSLNRQSYEAQALTWQGQEFLEKTRDNTTWNKTKRLLKTKGLTLTFDLIKVAASKVTEGLLT